MIALNIVQPYLEIVFNPHQIIEQLVQKEKYSRGMYKKSQNTEVNKEEALKAAKRIMSPEEAEEAEKKIGKEHKIIGLFIDNAKTYIQLATGGLVLSVNFMEKLILNESEKIPLNWLIIATWVPWLLSILSGAFYQYVGIKHLEKMESDYSFLVHKRNWKIYIPKLFINFPSIVYGVMMFFFYLGTIFFTVAAIVKLFALAAL